ncbi:MAG: hypothetical protein ACE5DI_00295 [Candidatus Micrarchaeia archaeon]
MEEKYTITKLKKPRLTVRVQTGHAHEWPTCKITVYFHEGLVEKSDYYQFKNAVSFVFGVPGRPTTKEEVYCFKIEGKTTGNILEITPRTLNVKAENETFYQGRTKDIGKILVQSLYEVSKKNPDILKEEKIVPVARKIREYLKEHGARKFIWNNTT